MCCRFVRQSRPETLAAQFGVDIAVMPFFAPSYNVAPQSTQPVVRLNRDTGRHEFALMRWGLVPFWAKDAKIAYTTFNARAEEVRSKPAFREAFKKRRCLIPADAFYEWQKLDAKTRQPWAIGLKSGDPCAFAGLWESWQTPNHGLSPVPTPAPALETFTILTTGPNELMQPIHNHMPVILPAEDYTRWLGSDPDSTDNTRPLIDMLHPYPAERMRAWPVSSCVGNVRNNDAALLNPAHPDPTSPQGSLFPAHGYPQC